MVEMTGVEPVSKNISARISPSAAFDLVIRFSRPPKAGAMVHYPVVPLCYRELTQSFPA